MNLTIVWRAPPKTRLVARRLNADGSLDTAFNSNASDYVSTINLQADGKIIMGDYSDREAGFIPLTYHTKQIAFDAGLRQACTDIVRFGHGASSGKKTYRSSFIPGLHDLCMVFEKREFW